MENKTNLWPIIASMITAVVALISLCLNSYFNFRDRIDARNNEILKQRKDALFNALQIVDNVYANETFDGKLPLHPYDWQLQDAREAMNKMIIYCAEPQITCDLFYKSIGLYNPTVQTPPGIHLKYLDDFRRQIAIELELPTVTYTDPDKVWIQNLAGGK